MDAGLGDPGWNARGREPLHQGRRSIGDQYLAGAAVELGGVFWRGHAGRHVALSRARASGRAADRGCAAYPHIALASAEVVALYSRGVVANLARLARIARSATSARTPGRCNERLGRGGKVDRCLTES